MAIVTASLCLEINAKETGLSDTSRFYLCYRRGKQESCALIALMDGGSSLSEFREYRHQYRDRYNSKTI